MTSQPFCNANQSVNAKNYCQKSLFSDQSNPDHSVFCIKNYTPVVDKLICFCNVTHTYRHMQSHAHTFSVGKVNNMAVVIFSKNLFHMLDVPFLTTYNPKVNLFAPLVLSLGLIYFTC